MAAVLLEPINYYAYNKFDSNDTRKSYLREVADSAHDFLKTGRCPGFSKVGENLLIKEVTHGYMFKVEETDQKYISSPDKSASDKLLNELFEGKNNNVENRTMEIYESLIPEITDEGVFDKDDFDGAIQHIRHANADILA